MKTVLRRQFEEDSGVKNNKNEATKKRERECKELNKQSVLGTSRGEEHTRVISFDKLNALRGRIYVMWRYPSNIPWSVYRCIMDLSVSEGYDITRTGD